MTDLSGKTRRLEIGVGDATHVSQADPVDLLALSCFRDDSISTPQAIGRALSDRGIEVGVWARNLIDALCRPRSVDEMMSEILADSRRLV